MGYGMLWDVHLLNRLERPKNTVPNAARDPMVFRWILEVMREVVFTQHPSDEGAWRVGVKRKMDPFIGHVGECKADCVKQPIETKEYRCNDSHGNQYSARRPYFCLVGGEIARLSVVLKMLLREECL